MGGGCPSFFLPEGSSRTLSEGTWTLRTYILLRRYDWIPRVAMCSCRTGTVLALRTPHGPQELLEHREALLQCLELRDGMQARLRLFAA